jgi:hypothetical protein
MDEKKTQDVPLSTKADAAFLQAAKKVIQRAKQTGTPIVVWEAGKVKEMPTEQLETKIRSPESEDVRA